MSVLYAEDDGANRRLMEIRLKRRGISVDSYENGKAALEAYQKGQYKLVILDLNMPELSGLEVMKEIRQQNLGQTVIALTSDDSQISQLERQGFTEVWIKPLLEDDYLNTIEGYLK